MIRIHTIVLLLAAAAIIAGCRTSQPPHQSVRQATSLLGQPLYPMPLADETRLDHEKNLHRAELEFAAHPNREDTIIWLGRRQAYLGRYDLAIETFSAGIEQLSRSHRLLRHRGHRFISTRQFERAVEDLESASALIHTEPDEVEADGLPNRLNKPRSTTHTNIYYHLGLAYYLRGEYDDALQSYQQCLAFCRNDDMLVATMYWTYLTLRRLGRDVEALALLAPISESMDIIENDGYLDLLLLYRGDRGIENFADRADAVQNATVQYGLSAWFEHQGDDAAARRMREQIVAGESWAAFGFIAAEADVARAGR